MDDLPEGEIDVFTASCPEGKVALSGGAVLSDDASLLYDAPAEGDGWLARAECPEDGECSVTVRVVCASVVDAAADVDADADAETSDDN